MSTETQQVSVCVTHSLHIKDGWLYKRRAQVVDDKSRDAKRDAILSERSNNQHLLQLIAAILPFSCVERKREEKQNKEADCGIQSQEGREGREMKREIKKQADKVFHFTNFKGGLFIDFYCFHTTLMIFYIPLLGAASRE